MDKIEFNEEEKSFLRKAKRIVSNIPKTVIPENADKSNTYTSKITTYEKANKEYDIYASGMSDHIN